MTQKPRFLPQHFTHSPSQKDRIAVIDYLQKVEVEGMRKHLCFSCAFVKLYDKNNKQYKVSRTMTLTQVKDIVEGIRKVNMGESK